MRGLRPSCDFCTGMMKCEGMMGDTEEWYNLCLSHFRDMEEHVVETRNPRMVEKHMERYVEENSPAITPGRIKAAAVGN